MACRRTEGRKLRFAASGVHTDCASSCHMFVVRPSPPCEFEPWLFDVKDASNPDDSLPSPIQQWPDVVLQVLWTPADPAAAVFNDVRVVLLGEAALPPLTSLRPRSRPLRLPLVQHGRRAPDGATTFEVWWEEILPEMLRRRRREVEKQSARQQRSESADKYLTQRRRRAELASLARDMEAELPGGGPICLESTYSAEVGLQDMLETCSAQAQHTNKCIMQTAKRAPLAPDAIGPIGALGSNMLSARTMPLDRFRDTDVHRSRVDMQPMQLSAGAFARTPRRPVSARRPASRQIRTSGCSELVDLAGVAGPLFVGDCCVDVDAACILPDQESRTDAYLEIILRSARVPPCGEGKLAVRVCEVEGVLADDGNCGASTVSLPRFPDMHPLWLSPAALLDTTPCFAAWNARAILPISHSAKLHSLRCQGFLSDSIERPRHRPAEAPRGVRPSFEWRPIQLQLCGEMPRGANFVDNLEVAAPAIQTSGLQHPTVRLTDAARAELPPKADSRVPCAPATPAPSRCPRSRALLRTYAMR